MKRANFAAGGYVLLDILIGILLFGLGITVMMGLTNTAVMAEAEAVNYLAAVNLAGSTMDRTLSALQAEQETWEVSPGQAVTDRVGRYERFIRVDWDLEDLLRVSVRVQWQERGANKNYSLESFSWVNGQ